MKSAEFPLILLLLHKYSVDNVLKPQALSTDLPASDSVRRPVPPLELLWAPYTESFPSILPR